MLILLIAIAGQSQVGLAQPAPKEDPIICRRQDIGSEVGTRLQRKKICMHKTDWDLIERQNKLEMDQYRNFGQAQGFFGPR